MPQAVGFHSVTEILPPSRFVSLRLKELWAYRELLYFLIWRDVKVRYKQTVLGIAWAVLQPFMTMVVFSIFFGKLAKMPSDGIPYPIFAYSALVPWWLFAYALRQSGNSLVMNDNLIKKVYFPRLLMPLASVLSGLVDFAVAFGVLLAMMFHYGMAPGWGALTLPFFVALVVATAFAAGLWLSALNVRYRDVRHTLPFLTQFWLFATPIAYPASLVPEAWRPLYGLNPMAGVVEGFRWALLGKGAPPGAMMAVSVAAVAVLLVSGLFYFRRMEQTFADLI